MAVINKTGITNGATIEAAHVTRSIDALSGGSTDTIIATGSFTGSLVGSLTGTGSYANQALSSSYTLTASYASYATNAASATSATNATNTAVTDTTTGTGPYYVTFVEATTGNVGQRVDSTGLTYNATTNTIAATASVATSASFATTASYVANASSFPYTGSARITGSLGVTGSLSVDGTITTSGITTLQNNLIVTGSTTTNGTITIQNGIYAASKTTIVDLGEIVNGSGYFQLPLGASVSPVAGAMYWDDTTGVLYVYQQSSTTWIAINP